jgi:two-component system sensor histidine kinase AlgZ
MNSNNKKLDSFFLPDLCNVRAVLVLILLCESLVMALVLIDSGLDHFNWPRFAMLSYFVQWIALLSVALLCLSRSFMSRLDLSWAVIWAMSLLLLVSFLVSIVSLYLAPLAGYGNYNSTSWVVRNMLISAIFGAMALRYFYVQSQWHLKNQAELSSRLEALQARIRPHFFFNSLNTVASLIMVDPEKAETMLVDLSSLFRVVLKDRDAQVSLAAEIELGRRYINIEQQRLCDRLQVDWQLPEHIPSIQVPQLLLQPLLENAIYHGIQPLISGGKVTIRLVEKLDERLNETLGEKSKVNKPRHDYKQRMKFWWLEIENDKPKESVESKGHQISLPNIKMRLDTVFGDKAELTSNQTANQYRVMIRLPEYNNGT